MKPFDRGYLALGVFVGIALATALYFWLEWFGYSLAVSSQFFATLLGAFVGGGIAIIGQLMTISHMSNQNEKVLTAKETALLLSLWEKTKEIHSLLLAYKRHIDMCVKDANVNSAPLPIAITPLAGHGINVRFEPAEKAQLIIWKEHETYNSIANLDLLAIGNIDHFSKFEAERSKLISISDIQNVDGRIVVKAKAGKSVDEVIGRLNVLTESLKAFIANVTKDIAKADLCLDFLETLIIKHVDAEFKSAPVLFE